MDIVLEDLTIESVAAEGKAIAHAPDGMVVFVEFAVPGDVVDVRVTRKKKAFLEGRIIKIKKESDRRLKPFCRHFGVCGGCKWQPLPYDLQLAAKQRQVYDQLVRIGHLEIPDIQPIIGSEKTEYYRNKLEFSFSERRWILADEDPEGLTEEQKLGLGFHVGKFFDKVLDIKDCHLQKEPSNAIRLFVKDYAVRHGLPFYNLRENHGLMRNMFIRTTDAGQVMLILCFAEESPAIFPMLDAISARFPEITSL
ncbi:MAG: class I SAM-dependent RNA methyltransferase [Schwartzia sp.]|nr:class I SAM-dependent RNA methyltransferase [Schwartzia sp. (in: firmicutes)]